MGKREKCVRGGQPESETGSGVVPASHQGYKRNRVSVEVRAGAGIAPVLVVTPSQRMVGVRWDMVGFRGTAGTGAGRLSTATTAFGWSRGYRAWAGHY